MTSTPDTPTSEQGRESRFELVETPTNAQPWHARFVAANGQTVWWTEPYADERDARRAIELITGNPVNRYRDTLEVEHDLGPSGLLEVRRIRVDHHQDDQ